MTRIGIVCPLPPCPSGPADWVADAAPLLADHLDVVYLVDDPHTVDERLRSSLDVRPVSERFDPTIDVVVYHLANNPHHGFVYRAAMDGPPGLCEVHDGTLHHMRHHLYEQDADAEAYQAAGFESHGEDGRDAVNMRRAFARGALELFLYDLLPHVLERHRGAIVHSEYAAHMLECDAPHVPTWLARLHAPVLTQRATKADARLPEERFVIGVFGYVAAPKRPLLIVDALAKAVADGLDGHLLFVGKDDTLGELQEAVRRAALDDRVTVTGFVDTARFHQLLTSVDAVVSLRAPNAGETSATLASALAAGRPTVVQAVGSWAELPDSVVIKVPADHDEAADLALALSALARDPERRERIGEAARAYATQVLSPHAYCESIVTAVQASRESAPTPRRHVEVAQRGGPRGAPWDAVLANLPRRPTRVLALDCPAWVEAGLRELGHDPVRCDAAGLAALPVATISDVIGAAGPPGPLRRARLASINRAIAGAGVLHLAVERTDHGGPALHADLSYSGFSSRSPRHDDPPIDLWPPPRARMVEPTLVSARKCGLPRRP